MSGGPAINDLVAAAFSSSEGDGSAELHESVESGKGKGPGVGSKAKTKEKLKSASYKKGVERKAMERAAAERAAEIAREKAAKEAEEAKRKEQEAKEKEKGGGKIPNNYGFPSVDEWMSKQPKGKYKSPSQVMAAYNAELTHFNTKHESKKP